MIRVEVPAEWLSAVGGVRRLDATGDTVRECLDDLVARYPTVAALRDDPMLNFFVNWENVRYRQGLDTPVGPGDTVQVVRFRA